MNYNPLKTLMERAEISREAMAKKLGLKADSIGKLLYQLDKEKAKICKDEAERRGYYDLDDDFARIASIYSETKLDIHDIASYEFTYLQQCLDIYRRPKTPLATALPDLVAHIAQFQSKSN